MSLGLQATPSEVSWARLSDRVTPYLHRETEGGPVLAWSLAHGDEWRGAYLMLNTSERPNVVVESTLSSVLLDRKSIPPKFFLSAQATKEIADAVSDEISRL